MDDNSLLVIILAFMLGCMCSGMMKQMCGQRLVEGNDTSGIPECPTTVLSCDNDSDCFWNSNVFGISSKYYGQHCGALKNTSGGAGMDSGCVDPSGNVRTKACAW